ncbi:sulfite exporter TauE/SafE family protein [uncultured Desulfosarcina sp.]|uniref:sulfite exporter TauE/SafE family protein n=1 Tax=uncultured Desulfosarcina sp. TaxID=218289 RepID=UPI0029C94577|nr:sulfite exporter TauE/SafE family protein [uncultured Desulfosarcina sp.]
MNGANALAFPAGVIIASLATTVGIGGGILWMPFFILVIKLSPETAVVTSLLVQTAGMGSGSLAFIRKRTADLPLAAFLLLLTLPGLGLGAILTRLLSSANLELALGVLTLTTAFLFVSANQKYSEEGQDRVPLKGLRRHGWIVSVLALASGMLSVSVGEWMVPLMRSRIKLRMRVAVATSIVTVFGTCVAGSLFHLMLGASADLSILIWAVPGVIVGGQIGPRFTERINERSLKEVFIFLLTLIGIHLIYNSY